MHDRRQRHERQIAQRNFERARGQTELGGGAANRLQTRSVGRGVTELANAREADFAPEMPADHSRGSPRRNPSRRSAAMCSNLADALLRFCGRARLRPRTEPLHRRSRRRLLCHRAPTLSCAARFGRQHLGREIERNARFRFRLVLREPLLQQLAELRDSVASDRAPPPARARASRQSLKRFDRRRARRTVQNRKLAEKIAVAIKGEIAFAPVVGMKARARPFSRMNIGPAGSPCRMMRLAFGNSTGVSFSITLRSAGTGRRPKLLNS